MSQLREYMEKKRAAGEKLLSIYLTAGFPTAAATLPLLETIAAAGADLIELGVPFSDPLADGPTIQNASQVALQNGMTVSGALELLGEFTGRNPIPTLLMGYANPFLHFGWEKLLDAAQRRGARGFIIPDLPPEESEDFCELARRRDLDLIFLVAPNSPPARVARIVRRAAGFIYAVSLTGVTGARAVLPPETKSFLQNLRSRTDRPILAGFGIAGPESARSIIPYCDGVIVGSAVIKTIQAQPDLSAAKTAVAELVAGLKAAISQQTQDDPHG